MNRKILISFLLIGLVAVVVGCSQAGTLPDIQPGPPQLAGSTPVAENPVASDVENPQPNKEEVSGVVKIGDIMGAPENYQGQAVVVEGKIISECGAGCWFTLNDGTGTIYVDLAPSNLVIPQKRGAFARVYGKVVREGGDTYLIGTRVEF